MKAQLKLEVQPPTKLVQLLRACFEACRWLLSRTSHGPLRLAVAASKKSGKSTLINFLLGHDLAPKNSEIPTPACCEYSSWAGLSYRLHYNGESQDFVSAATLKKTIEEKYKKVQFYKSSNGSLAGLKVQYPGTSRLPVGWNLLDTPGPDAATFEHKQIAQKAVAECDSVIFLIDYSKYLTEDEHAYLCEVKANFAQKTNYQPLVILLNKMDLPMQEKGAKSWIKSTDFIRCRLEDIDPEFSECLVFPISALISANLITLAETSADNAEVAALMKPETAWTRSQYSKIEALAALDEAAMTAASNLFAEAERMKRLVDSKNVTTKEIRDYSGIEYFLNYMHGSLQTATAWAGLRKSARLCSLEVQKIYDSLKDSNRNLQPAIKNICAPFLEQWQKIAKEFGLDQCPTQTGHTAA